LKIAYEVIEYDHLGLLNEKRTSRMSHSNIHSNTHSNHLFYLSGNVITNNIFDPII